MLRFSLRKAKEPTRGSAHAAAGEEDQADGNVVRVNYTSRTWLASLRKRTLSVESLSNMFTTRSDSVRRESQNSTSGSLSGGNNSKLMRSHKMQTKSGDPVDIYFGYDALSINGRSIAYGDVVFWSHSASHFTMTYLSKASGRRKDVVLYPTEKGPKPSSLTEMLGTRIARLVADQTGCSEEKAMRMATAKANESELREAVQALDEHISETGTTGNISNSNNSAASNNSNSVNNHSTPAKFTIEKTKSNSSNGLTSSTNPVNVNAMGRIGGSGMIEVNTTGSLDDGISRPIKEEEPILVAAQMLPDPSPLPQKVPIKTKKKDSDKSTEEETKNSTKPPLSSHHLNVEEPKVIQLEPKAIDEEERQVLSSLPNDLEEQKEEKLELVKDQENEATEVLKRSDAEIPESATMDQ